MSFVYWVTWSVCRFVYATFFRWHVIHPERVPVTGSVILAANHASFIDPPLVGCGLPRPINYLARDTLFRFPGIGWYLRALNAVGFRITSISDVTPVPHNGCRPPKRRRI